LVGGLRIAILDGAQKPGDMVHHWRKYLAASHLTTILTAWLHMVY
jgi:hypothetical protein